MNIGMTQRLVFLVLPLAALSLAAAEKIDLERRTPVSANEPIPIADFFRPAFLLEPKINPAGTHVAALLATGEDRHRLIVYELGTTKLEMFDAGGESDTYNVNWLDDHRVVFGIGLYKTYGAGLYAADVGRLRDYYPLLQFVGSRLIAVPQANRTRPLAWLAAGSLNTGKEGEVVVVNSDIRTGQSFNLLTVATSGSDMKEVEESNQKHIEQTFVGPKEGDDAGFLADKQGKLAFGFTASDGVFTMYRWMDGHWEKSPVNLDEVDVLGCGRTHDEVVVLGKRREGQPRPLQFFNAATGQPGDVLLQDQAYDFNGSLYYDPASRDLFGVSHQRSGPTAVWFTPTYVALQKVLDGYFPGLVVQLIGADETGRMLVVETYSDRQPSTYYWINLEKKSFGLIEKSRPWLDPQRMQPSNIMSYKTRDGQKMDAYVTLPAGASKKNPVPLVVLPPGSPEMLRNDYRVPHERATWGFDSVTQFLVSRGYAVLRPNHRGSAGYNWMFPAADQWDLPKMADDVVMATRHLLKTGVIDEKRIGIAGFGVSGYFAVAAAEADPDLFRAVVTFHGTYDWGKFLRAQKYFPGVNYGVLARNLGGASKLEAISVTGRLNQIHAAVLVGYQREAGDSTAQSTSLLADLERANVVHESLPVGNERSTINLLRNQIELYSRADEFLAKFLKPVAPVVTK